MNDMLKQIKVILQSYATYFTKQGKTIAEIKTSVGKMNGKMENTIIKLQDN